MNNKYVCFVAGFLTLFGSSFMSANEHPIGEPQEIGGIQYSAVYLPAVEMSPHMRGMVKKKDADFHLELDIHATKDAVAFGFSEGDFIPYLIIEYTLQKAGSNNVQKGTLVPMVAADGIHYGTNIKLKDGHGKYKLTYNVHSLNESKGKYKTSLYRHTDETGPKSAFPDATKLEYEFEFKGF